MTAFAPRILLRVRTFLAMLALGPLAPLAALAGTFDVTTTADTGPGSLRQAMTSANAVAAGTAVTIRFDIPGAGPHVIRPATQLPSLTRGDIRIDGYTQAGSSPNSLPLGQNNAVLKIQIDGNSTLATAFDFTDQSGLNLIRGLSITRFTDAAFTQRESSFGGACCTVIIGNWLGFAPDGTPMPNRSLLVTNNAPEFIGQAGEGNQNLIVTSQEVLQASGLANVRIWNNMFGIRPDGTPLSGASYFQGGAILRGGFGFCCPDSGFTAHLFVGDPVQGGNIFAGLSGAAVQAGTGTTLSRNLFIDPPTFVLDNPGAEPAPSITAVTFGNGSTVIAGGFASGKANQDMRMEFFASDAPDPLGYGAADAYLGSTVVTSSPSGAGTFTFTAQGDEPYLGVTKTPGDNTSRPAVYVGPRLTATPGPVAITASVGSPADQVVAITNQGTNFVTFGTLSVTGTGLSLLADGCSGKTVPGSGGTCSVTVRFAPAALGVSIGRVSAPVVAAGSPMTVAGITTTFVTDVTATAQAVAFPLTVSRIGNGAGRVASSEVPAVIDCGATCSANYSAGSVVTLAATPEPGSSFAFWAGECSGTQPTCTVTMSQARNVSAGFVLGSVSTGGTVAMSLAAPDSIVLGQSLTVSVSLVGTPAGAISGSVTFFNGSTALCTSAQPVVANAASCTVTPSTTMPLAVWATYSGSPAYQPSQATPKAVAVVGAAGARVALDFGTVLIGAASDPQTVLVGNPTAATIGIAVSTTGDYSMTSACPAQLAPAATCPVTITFRPLAAGARNGTLSVQSTPQASSTQIDLAGTGIAGVLRPLLVANPATLLFGAVETGFGGLTATFTVANSGPGEALGLSVGSAFGYSVSNGCGTTLAPSASCAVTVQFVPPFPGTFNPVLEIDATNAASPTGVSLQGTSTRAARVKLLTDTASVTAAPGVASALRVLAFREVDGCRRGDGTTVLGDCARTCTIVSPGLYQSTTQTISGPCPDTCEFAGRQCTTNVLGQDVAVRQGVANVRVDWAGEGLCAASPASSLSGADGWASGAVTVTQPGLCQVFATTTAAPAIQGSVGPEKVTFAVDASAPLQATAATLTCPGDSSAAGAFQYRKAQGPSPFTLAFVARNAAGGPAPNVRIAIAGSALNGGSEPTTDSAGRVSIPINVATRRAQDYAVNATVVGTAIAATCNVRVLQTITTIVSAPTTELPENVVNGAGEFIGSRSGKFCALLKDAAGQPVEQSGEEVEFAGPAQRPTVRFAVTNNHVSQGVTDASGIACSKTAVIAIDKPDGPYDFDVAATYRFKDNSTIQTAYALARTSASQGELVSGLRRMNTVNAIQSAAVGTAYGQDLCVVIKQQTGSMPYQCPMPGQTGCSFPVFSPVGYSPVLFEVLSSPGGASVGLRGATAAATSPSSSSLQAQTSTSSGSACVKATANAVPGTTYVQATNAVGTMLFTLVNTPEQPNVIAMGASTVTIASNALYGEPIAVQVKNASGQPIAGATVNFTITMRQGPFPGEAVPTVSPSSRLTNNLGIATTNVSANGSFRPFSVVATTLLAKSKEGAKSIENGVFETEFYFAPVDVPDPSLDPGGDADGDGIPNGVEIAAGSRALDKDNDVFGQARLFTMQQYRDFLGREGEPAGIQFYVDQLGNGTMTREQVIESFFNSPEFQSLGASITRLYLAFFNRFPDYAGFLFQTAALRSGQPVASVANNFSLSPEFQSTYGALDDTQYVQLLYANVLGRGATTPEIDFHVQRLASGASRGDVMAGFSESPEYAGARSNEVYASMMYMGLLRRAPEPAGIDFYVGLMRNGLPPRDVIPGFFNSPEYHDRFLPP